MSTGPGSYSPKWRSAPSYNLPPTSGLAWQSLPTRVPYRPRWRWFALAAAGGFTVLGVVIWVALWLRPPAPARLVVWQAGYDANLSVPPNPYGKAAARDLAALATPGTVFGNRGRLHGTPEPVRLTRPGPAEILTELGAGRERCVVAILAAHGGRDRDGAFLFPDDATPDPAHRLRIKAVIDRLGQLPENRQKLLILDATQCPAFPDVGLVHNDFAAAVEELHDAIANVPNLVVFMSSGTDQRSWVCPEWGMSAFAHFLRVGLTGAADADRDRRVNAWELIEYVRPQVHDWARDNRAALQDTVVLPRGDEGERRARAMHLVSTDGKPTPAAPAPTPFEPPAELRQAWDEYRTLANSTPPPEAYTPHLWRQYEAWTLRYEHHLTVGDTDGAKVARDRATRVKQQIEDDRKLAVRPQTLALPAGIGQVRHFAEVPDAFRTGIARIARQPKDWDEVRTTPTGVDADTARLLWGRALLEYVAEDPIGRRAVVPQVLPLIEGGFAVRPAELHFMAMVAAHVPQPDTATGVGPLLKQVLPLRLLAERAAACVPDAGYPYAEFCQPWVLDSVRKGDEARRQAEDLCFATSEADWAKAATFAVEAAGHYGQARSKAEHVRALVTAWHTGAARGPGLGEWLVRDAGDGTGADRLARESAFRAELDAWKRLHEAGTAVRTRGSDTDPAAFDAISKAVTDRLRSLEDRVAKRTDELLTARPEFEGKVTPRAEAVTWWHTAEAALTAPPGTVAPARRVDLVRDVRRVSRQLLVAGRTQPEALPEVGADVTRERAFDAARRRGLFQLARLGQAGFDALGGRKPGESYSQVEFRLGEFGFPAAGRQSLAEAGSRIGQVLNELPAAVGTNTHPTEADRLARLATPAAAAEITAKPAVQFRKAGVREVLLTQARRTLADHWYDDRGGPYYRQAIELLAADANNLPPPPAGAPNDFTALVAAKEEFPVQVTAPTRIAVTDEPEPVVAVSFAGRGGASGRPGFPVFWVDPPFQPAPKAGEVRHPDRIAVSTVVGGTQVYPLPRPPGPAPTSPVARSGDFRVSGFFRGRPLGQAVAVGVYSVPHQTAATVPPADPYAKLAVRADPALAAKYALGAGSVVFVLDCSGSMRPDPNDRNSRGLYPVAVDALRDVLAALPPGTTVSVRTFGQLSRTANTPEDTIREFYPPTRIPLARATVTDTIVNTANAVRVDELHERSPVVRAVLDAKESLKTAPGPFKAVVLISDAVDTRFAVDPKFAGAAGVKGVLRAEFTDAGIPLCVVALPVTNPTEAAAQKEFEVVTALRPAGKFVPPAKAKELGEWLRTGLNPRVRYTVTPVQADGPAEPFDLTAATAAPDDWSAGAMAPGRYRLSVEGDLGFRHDVQVEPGDRLLLDLSEDRGTLSLKRLWFAATAPTAPGGRAEEGVWRLALLQNRLEAGRVRMVATVEDEPQPAERITVSRIGDAWFEVEPVAGGVPVAVRWRAAPGFPAPAWSIDVAGWPGGQDVKGLAAPVVRAWWQPNGLFPRAGEPWVPAGRRVVGVRGETISAGDATAVLDAVTIERHSVEVKPGAFEERECLVARLTHPPGRTAWVRPIGVPPAGSEVRVYRAANKVTCLFWWDGVERTADAANARVPGFEVVTLAGVKAGPSAKLTDAPAPSENSPVADPPAGR